MWWSIFRLVVLFVLLGGIQSQVGSRALTLFCGLLGLFVEITHQRLEYHDLINKLSAEAREKKMAKLRRELESYSEIHDPARPEKLG